MKMSAHFQMRVYESFHCYIQGRNDRVVECELFLPGCASAHFLQKHMNIPLSLSLPTLLLSECGL